MSKPSTLFSILLAALLPIPALAQDQQAGSWLSLIPLVLLFVVFYFVLIRPQQKKAKQHKAMTSALKKGDEIITYGGMLGRVSDVGDDFLSVDLADNVTVRVQRSGVAALMPKGTYRALSE